MKLVINQCYGGFGLSQEAIKRYWEIKGQPIWIEQDSNLSDLFTVWLVAPEDRIRYLSSREFYDLSNEDRRTYNNKYSEQTWYCRNVYRADPILVQVVEELGEAASGRYADLKVVEIPDDVSWEINEYDGLEHVAEMHRTWS